MDAQERVHGLDWSVRLEFRMALGVWWDATNRERRCILVVSGHRIVFGLDVETQRLIPDSQAAIQEIPSD